MACHVWHCKRDNEILMFHVKHWKGYNMTKNSELYNRIKKEIYETFAREDIITLSSYMVMVYDYWKKEWIEDREKEMLFDLINYSVKLLLERK